MLEMVVNDFSWRVVRYGIRNAPWQMAVDHALLEIMNRQIRRGDEVKPIIRVYRFDRGAVILGHEQKGRRFGDMNGYDFTTRVSGGGHMYFSSDDIHYCAVVPRSMLPEDLIESYRMLNEPVVRALRMLGFNARLGRTSIKIDMDEEKTLVGTAQRRMNYAVLQHGSVLLHDYGDEVFKLLHSKEDEIRVWKDKIIALSMLNGKIDLNEVARKITLFYADEGYKETGLTGEEVTLAEKLYREVYTNPKVIGKGSKEKEHICLIEGLMTDDYTAHVRQNSGL
ncbi:lipoate--protein ligase family protein [Candidatus Woesearchaeota archaeon]|nr:lipoate--protein ligase family protein [Candidatus Woesearchaeota archaeon]